MSLTPIPAASLQSSTQDALRRLAPTAEQLTVADVKGPGKLDADANGEISDGEFTGAAISDVNDQAQLRSAYAAHANDPTSPLVQFGTPTADVPAEGETPVDVPAEGETPVETPPAPTFNALGDAAGLTEPRAVLKDAALETRLNEMDASVTQGLEVLNAQKTELEARWNALDEADTAGRAELGPQLEQTVAAMAKLTELQTLLKDRSNPQAVQALQNFLIDNDNGTSAEPSFDSRLSYPRGNETVSGADNLYGARTDAALRDFVGRTVQETRVPGPHARVQPPSAEVPAVADSPPAEEQAVVADAPPTDEAAVVADTPADPVVAAADTAPEEVADSPVSATADQPVINWPENGGLSFGTTGWMSLTDPKPFSSELAFSPWTSGAAVSGLPLGYDASVWTPSFYQPRPNPTLDLSMTGFSTFDPARFGPQP